MSKIKLNKGKLLFKQLKKKDKYFFLAKLNFLILFMNYLIKFKYF
jgi:hypothetical protein